MNPIESADASKIALASVSLGRNRISASLVGHDGLVQPVLVDGADGIVTRWVGDHRTERVTDRIIQLVSADELAEARKLCSDLASRILPPGLRETPTVVSIPAAFGPVCEQAVADGFSDHCWVETLVKRPVTSLGTQLSAFPRLLDDPGLIVDNDGGELSVAAIDPERRLVFPPSPLSTGPTDDPDTVTERLLTYIREVRSHLPSEELLVDNDPESSTARFANLVLTGPGAREPGLISFVRSLFPTANIDVASESRPSEDILSLGPLHSEWAAGWPTASVAITDARLRIISADHEPYPLRLGPLSTEAIQLPRDLVDGSRVRTLADGRLLVLGEPGTRPLTMRVRWPLTSGAPMPLDVTSVGTRPIQLVDPEEVRPRARQ